jgi:hypothetical protein
LITTLNFLFLAVPFDNVISIFIGKIKYKEKGGGSLRWNDPHGCCLIGDVVGFVCENG